MKLILPGPLQPLYTLLLDIFSSGLYIVVQLKRLKSTRFSSSPIEIYIATITMINVSLPGDNNGVKLASFERNSIMWLKMYYYMAFELLEFLWHDWLTSSACFYSETFRNQVLFRRKKNHMNVCKFIYAVSISSVLHLLLAKRMPEIEFTLFPSSNDFEWK